jgi:beta-hydroxyacyl-[acyl carrier protein] dehydratase FabZ
MSAPLLQLTDILKYLPHRYPFLLLDRVISVEAKTIHAYKNVTFNEPFFQGHFPGKPVMPGVLILEALAQTGGLMVLYNMEADQYRNKIFLFASIERARFRAPVVPGDRLDFECTQIGQKLNLWKISAVARVDGKPVAQAELTAAMIDAG